MFALVLAADDCYITSKLCNDKCASNTCYYSKNEDTGLVTYCCDSVAEAAVTTLGTGLLILIIVIPIAFVIAIIVLCVCCCKTRKQNQQNQQVTVTTAPAGQQMQFQNG